MIKEALQWLAEQADKARKIQTHRFTGSREDVVYYDSGGELKMECLLAAPRRDTASTIDDFVGLVKAVAKPAQQIDPPEEGIGPLEIFVGTNGVVARLVGRGVNRETITMPLTMGREWTMLKDMERSRQALRQEELLRRLRTDLIEVFPDTIVNSFSTLTFKNHEGGTSTIDAGKRSVGRAVDQELLTSGGAKLLTEAVGGTRVYQEVGWKLGNSGRVVVDDDFQVLVRCAVDYDFEASGIVLVPVARDLVAGEQRTLQLIAERISAGLADSGSKFVVVLGSM